MFLCTKKPVRMKKVKEPVSIYYSRPQLIKLKESLMASIEREEDIEVLRNCAELLHLELDSDDPLSMDASEWESLRDTPLPYCFSNEELEKEIEESEKSGWANDDDVNTFIDQWKNLR